MTTENVQPQRLFFKDDGKFPNSKLPTLLYKGALAADLTASKVQQTFAQNNWSNSWDNGIYDYHHYHSTSHEVLGVYAGSALLHLGGEKGDKVRVEAGDIIVIPAGVAHKKLSSSDDFAVVGAYPEGRDWDVLKGEPGERPAADKSIASLPVPSSDPLTGTNGALLKEWSNG